jgi:translation initiation factor 2B subunit (eIF-2B alpha/beta/delta family)
MNTIRFTVTGIILLAFIMNIIGAAQEDKSPDELVDDIEEYNGSIGPEDSLYGLKLAFEGLDESFTLNTTEKLEKKIFHSRLRISEAKTELKKKNYQGAKKAFEYYKEKLKETEDSIQSNSGNDSEIFNAQKLIEKHQYVLERLFELHPDNAGLLNAINNSIELEYKFEEKTDRKLERIRTNEGKHYLRELNTENKWDNESGDLKNFKYDLKLEGISIDNNTQVKIKLNFVSNKTDNDSIADEIRNELRLSKDNISSRLKFGESNDSELRSLLIAQARVGLNLSVINVDYMFVLDKTNRTEIINVIHDHLSNLTTAQILEGLEIKEIQDGRNQDGKKIEGNDKIPEISDKKFEENDKIPEVSDKGPEENDKIPEEKSDGKEEMGQDNHDTTRQKQNDT